MSDINIKGAVKNIKSMTNVYTPIVEVVVNAIQAIEGKNESNGKIIIIAKRAPQISTDGTLSDIESFEIKDNGIGFTNENRKSFDTLYSEHKIKEGGKGFGRFVCLKYFEGFSVDSIYAENGGFKRRKFSMGNDNAIVVHEKIESTESNMTGSTILLSSIKAGKFPDKTLHTIGRNLVEKILPYLITTDYICPEIIIKEADDSNSITLNDFVNNKLSNAIKEIEITDGEFSLSNNTEQHDFTVRVFKFYSPKNQKSKISLVAHKREVTNVSLHNYIPEFLEEFYEKDANGHDDRERNFIIRAYVFGDYFDDNVSLERGDFIFPKGSDSLFGITQNAIESTAATRVKEVVGDDVEVRQNKKKERVKSYVSEEAPWHKDLLNDIDLSQLPFKPTDEEIEMKLQMEKHKQEITIKKEVIHLLATNNIEDLNANAEKIINKISLASKNDLIHYVVLRRNFLTIFKKSLELDTDGKYSSEGVVHDIIFPRRSDSEITSFNDHNLWIIDERANFADYVSSDLPLNGSNSERPDLLVYDKAVLFRGDDEPSNPITIFEFKKPQRDDFANPSSNEDPIQQVVRYVNSIREGKYKTPQGRNINIAANTRFYGYIVCDISSKVETWLETEKNFKPMPDRLGWFMAYDNINLYMEVLSWNKVLKDAEMRNKIFFHKLGIC